MGKMEKFPDQNGLPLEGVSFENEVPPRPLKPGEKGYVSPGFKLRDDGNLVDEKGSVYNERYELLEKASSDSPEMLAQKKKILENPETKYYHGRALTELAEIMLRAQKNNNKKK